MNRIALMLAGLGIAGIVPAPKWRVSEERYADLVARRDSLDDEERVDLLIAAAERGLAAGTIYRAVEGGRLLTTVEDVLTALVTGGVEILDSEEA